MQDKMRDSAFIVVGFILLAGIMVVMLIGVRGGVEAHNYTPTLAEEKPGLAPSSPSTGRRVQTVLPERGVPATLRPVFDAIRQVESAGNDRAVGDEGKSLGPYQISRAYWNDACEYGQIDFDYDIYIWSRSHGEAIMSWYWQRYGATTDEQRARLHNGGPTMQGTDEYWAKVKAIMEANQ